MQPLRLLVALLGGVAALAILGSVVRPRRVPRALLPTLRRNSLPRHFNRLAAYYYPCVN
jgi:hypothetical protein